MTDNMKITTVEANSPEGRAILKMLGLEDEAFRSEKTETEKMAELMNQSKAARPELIDRILLFFGIVRRSKMSAMIALTKRLTEVAKHSSEQLIDAEKELKFLSPLNDFAAHVGINSINREHLGHDENGNCVVKFTVDIDLPKSKAGWAEFGYSFDLTEKPEGTKDFDPKSGGYGTSSDGTL